jgi:rRNA large subunit m3Psi methyltransferase RlmH
VRVVLAAGKAPRTPWAEAAVENYGARVERTFPFSTMELGPALKSLRTRDRLVVIDERGQALDSLAWAAMLEDGARAGATAMVFAIGGADGHDDATRARAWKVVSLGPIVLNHAVARVVVAEQLYRACDIRAGGPYHRGD